MRADWQQCATRPPGIEMRRERRIAERYDAYLPVEFRCGSIHGKGRLMNASLAGARIEAVTGQPFPGEEIRLFLWLPSSP